MATPQRFVLDTMLGKLARWLRAMGYDALYFKAADDRYLLQLARAEARTLLTRDAKLARLAGPGGLLIRATEIESQMAEVLERLALRPSGDASCPGAWSATRCSRIDQRNPSVASCQSTSSRLRSASSAAGSARASTGRGATPTASSGASSGCWGPAMVRAGLIRRGA